MSAPVQLRLAVDDPCATLCGYCLRALERQPGGDYACPRCKPLLALVRDAVEWASFQQRAWADRIRG